MFGYGFKRQGPWFLTDSNGQPFQSGQACMEFGKAQVFFADMNPEERKELRLYVAEINEVPLGDFAFEMGEAFLGDLKERVISQITDEGAEEVISAIETAVNDGGGEVDEDGMPEFQPDEVMLDVSGNLRDLMNFWADKYNVPHANKTVRVWEFKEDDPWRQQLNESAEESGE